MTTAAAAGIVEIERELDGLLHSQDTNTQHFRTLGRVQREWTQAIWNTAESLGPSTPSLSELERGLGLSQRPVFVCGTGRSGTTMLRDLLDGHPELVVIPNESRFYTLLEPALMGVRPERHLSFLGRSWLERLIDVPPFWLLGRSERNRSPYVAFARELAGWWRVPERHSEARVSSWPLAAFALAYAQRSNAGRLSPRVRMWVEKTPGNERFLTQIWHDFPAAKVIHIVRRPEAVLASTKAVPTYGWTRRTLAAHVLGRIAPSYRVAARLSREREDRYCLVRFEDLTAEPGKVMGQISEFLEIEALPSLLQPTTAGRPAFNNSSFRSSRPDLRRALDPFERALLALAASRPAAKLGYVPGEAVPAGHAIIGRNVEPAAAANQRQPA